MCGRRGGCVVGRVQRQREEPPIHHDAGLTLSKPRAWQCPGLLKGTIFERADLRETEPFRVSGYGLVAGLRGTGDNSAIPRLVREYMVKERARGGFGSHNTGMENVSPEAVLRDPRTRWCESMHYPPGARQYNADLRQNDRFDIYVSCLKRVTQRAFHTGNSTPPTCRIMGANPRNPAGSVNTYAVAGGPVFVNPTYGLASAKSVDAAAQSSLRYGMVMDGGVSQFDNPLVLRVRDPQYSRHARSSGGSTSDSRTSRTRPTRWARWPWRRPRMMRT